jgi:hypothetical protein
MISTEKPQLAFTIRLGVKKFGKSRLILPLSIKAKKNTLSFIG